MSKHTAWAAGFFEGEGWLHIRKQAPRKDRRNVRYSLVVGVTNTEKPLLLRLSRDWGGRIRPRTGTALSRKPLFAWAAYGQVAERFLRAIRPHLVGVKRAKTELAIAFQKRVRPKKRRRDARGRIAIISDAELATREAMFKEIRK